MTKLLFIRFAASILLLAMAVFAILTTHPVSAQENETPVTIQQLRIQVMPEFDDPRVLVIVQGRLNAGAEELPRPVTFRVPLGAQINQMATMNVTDGSTVSQAYNTAPDPADPRWTQVTYTVDSAHFFYEYYYDPGLTGRERDFTYLHSSLQPVNDLQVEIQQPLRATDFTTDPAAALTRTDAMLGFTYHQFTPGNLAAGETWSANVTYSKSDQDPSLSREAVMAMQSGDPAAVSTTNLTVPPAATTNTLALPDVNSSWLLAVVGVVVIAAGVFMIRSRRMTKAEVVDEALDSSASTPANFCPHCGTAVKAEARYCHYCGNNLHE